MDTFSFTPMAMPPRPDSQENRDQDKFGFNLSKAAQAEHFKAWERRMDQSSTIPLSPVISSTVNKPANSNKNTGILAASPSSNQRFQTWLASTNAALASPKPGSIVDNSPFPGKAPAARLPKQGGKVAGPAGRSPHQHTQHTQQQQQQQQKPLAAAWYVRTPAPAPPHKTPKADQHGGGADSDDEEYESSDRGSEGEQEEGSEGGTEGEAFDQSPSLGPSASATPATAGRGLGCRSPGSAMAMTDDCIKSLSRLRFNTSAGEDAMQISPCPPLQPQQQQQQQQQSQSGYEPETPLLFNMGSSTQANTATTPTLARVLHFEQQPEDEFQQQQQQQQTPKLEQPATPALVGSTPLCGSLGGTAEGPYGLTPIQDVIGLMRSPAAPMPMGLDD